MLLIAFELAGTTSRYAHLSRERLREAVEVVPVAAFDPLLSFAVLSRRRQIFEWSGSKTHPLTNIRSAESFFSKLCPQLLQ